MSSFYKSAKNLIKLVNTNLSIENYIKNESGFSTDLPEIAADLSTDELEHETAHKNVWTKYGIKSSFHRDSRDKPFTAANDDDLKKYIDVNKITKKSLISLYLEVVTAPKILGYSDNIQKKILEKEINSLEKLRPYII